MKGNKLYYGDGSREAVPGWMSYELALEYARVRAKYHGGLRGMVYQKKEAHRPDEAAR